MFAHRNPIICFYSYQRYSMLSGSSALMSSAISASRLNGFASLYVRNQGTRRIGSSSRSHENYFTSIKRSSQSRNISSLYPPLRTIDSTTKPKNQYCNKSIHIDQTIYLAQQTSVKSCNNKTVLPTHNISTGSTLSGPEYEVIVDNTLHSLTDYFDEILEKSSLEDFDVTCSDGVLTVKLGPGCTYVINKQTPNKQVWLSSPSSGPKRYDFINQTWIYKHDGQGKGLFDLLNTELRELIKGVEVDFVKNCAYGKAILPNSTN